MNKYDVFLKNDEIYKRMPREAIKNDILMFILENEKRFIPHILVL